MATGTRIVHGRLNTTTNDYMIIAEMKLDATSRGFSIRERKAFLSDDRDIRIAQTPTLTPSA